MWSRIAVWSFGAWFLIGNLPAHTPEVFQSERTAAVLILIVLFAVCFWCMRRQFRNDGDSKVIRWLIRIGERMRQF